MLDLTPISKEEADKVYRNGALLTHLHHKAESNRSWLCWNIKDPDGYPVGFANRMFCSHCRETIFFHEILTPQESFS